MHRDEGEPEEAESDDDDDEDDDDAVFHCVCVGDGARGLFESWYVTTVSLWNSISNVCSSVIRFVSK
uniref:Uncharacterized protein n=1 Tax=Physcomitrium patens TaxID=3218 RepID=A0A2K1IJX5_PHYPA|nr:hypothetical protein PHYPA_028274 [Physcomitrium patens]